MAPYSPERVRDDTLLMLDRLHKERESRLVVEINDLQRRYRNPGPTELKQMWGMEAKVEAQFAYMRRLIRTEGFVMRTMSDFDGLDRNGSGALSPEELQQFVSKRDGGVNTKHTILSVRANELLRDLDVDGDGLVSRKEWLMYMTYLHWQAFIEENVVENIVEVTKEYKNDKTGIPVLVENIVQHPPKLRGVAQGNNNQSTGCTTLDKIRGTNNRNNYNNQSIVERTHENPDGSIVTTIEHLTSDQNRKKFGQAAAWCGMCR